jgi:hypothetical protein
VKLGRGRRLGVDAGCEQALFHFGYREQSRKFG